MASAKTVSLLGSLASLGGLAILFLMFGTSLIIRTELQKPGPCPGGEVEQVLMIQTVHVQLNDNHPATGSPIRTECRSGVRLP